MVLFLEWYFLLFPKMNEVSGYDILLRWVILTALFHWLQQNKSSDKPASCYLPSPKQQTQLHNKFIQW